MTITLPSALDRIVREKVNAGLYANETELVCEALRHEFARDLVHEWVRAQAAAGFAQLDAGEYEDISRDELMSRLAQRRSAASCA
jgi:Arc/MetJ-type ribon-helix-helix transcriptional regulator